MMKDSYNILIIDDDRTIIEAVDEFRRLYGDTDKTHGGLERDNTDNRKVELTLHLASAPSVRSCGGW